MVIEVELNIPPHTFVVRMDNCIVGPEHLAALSNVLHHWIHGVECFRFEHATYLLTKVMEELDYSEDDDTDEDAIEEPPLPEHRFRELL